MSKLVVYQLGQMGENSFNLMLHLFGVNLLISTMNSNERWEKQTLKDIDRVWHTVSASWTEAYDLEL